MPLPIPLRPGRVHEVQGPAAFGFAAILAGLSLAGSENGPSNGAGNSLAPGPLWIRPRWRPDLLFPDGLAALMPPGRLLIAQSPSEADSLAIAEEALRDGVIGLVILETTKPLGLREGRRLQLAAGQGRTTGLCLIPEGAGSNAAETRWHCRPHLPAPGQEAQRQDAPGKSGPGKNGPGKSAGATGPGSTLMHWEIIKNKSGTLGAWHVCWNAEAHRIDLVSPPPLGAGLARAAAGQA